MTLTFGLVVTVVIIALIFDFFNGFHDAANAISTIVAAKTLRPGQAVILAAIANFTGYFIFGVAVAHTIGTGVIDVKFITLPIVISALLGAILWNIITWLLGLPTSSSHALIGGLVGAAISAVGPQIVILSGILKIVSFIIIAPLIGITGAIIFTAIVIRFCWRIKTTQPKANKVFRVLQWVTAFANGLGHGANDAQKSMGIIALALVAGGVNQLGSKGELPIDNWVVLSCYTAISIGTMLGGWRIVKTMGSGITKIRPMEGFCADTASAFTLLITAHFGIPVSTTHVVAGSIMGVGTVEHAASVRWITARKIVWAWLLTIPLTATCSALVFQVLHFGLSFIK